MANLVSRLSLPEAIGLSLSIISPTVTAAFNISLVVQYAGPAAPLTFAIGMIAMAFVALSFIAFTHRVAHAGSAYAYIAHTFGKRAGFIGGCALLLTYVGFTTGFAALVGSFVSAALSGLSIELGSWWVAVASAALLLAWWLAYRDMRLAGRLMFGLEAGAILAIVALCFSILHQVHPSAAQTLASFQPSPSFRGWSGLGYGMVFSILSFGGFEGAATLGEETVNPRRNIPIALFSTVVGSGIFFVFVAYCEVIGFGTNGIKDLGQSQAPLNDLALRYASPRLAIALDLAAAASCFSGMIGGISAAGRILFAISRGGLSPALSKVHPVHGTPAPAVSVAAMLIFLPILLWAPFSGSGNYYSYTSTIGVLALILVYIAVGTAETIEAWCEHQRTWATACLVGPILLLVVLYCNLYPVPDFPNNLWPYVAFIWVIGAWALTRWRPGVTAAG